MERNLRRSKIAVVVKISGDKTIKVKTERRVVDPKYKKIIKRSKLILVHDEENKAKVGDLVEIMETRPLSKTKFWRLVSIKTHETEEEKLEKEIMASGDEI